MQSEAAFNKTDAWYWEGNVQGKVAAHLTAEGWRIIRTAKTAKREPGIDILAEMGGRTLAVEVKGYPPERYTQGLKRGQLRPTGERDGDATMTVAEAYYAASVVPAQLESAMAFPIFLRYRRDVERLRQALQRLGIGVYFVAEDGSVHQEIPHRPVTDEAAPASQ